MARADLDSEPKCREAEIRWHREWSPVDAARGRRIRGVAALHEDPRTPDDAGAAHQARPDAERAAKPAAAPPGAARMPGDTEGAAATPWGAGRRPVGAGHCGG